MPPFFTTSLAQLVTLTAGVTYEWVVTASTSGAKFNLSLYYAGLSVGNQIITRPGINTYRGTFIADLNDKADPWFEVYPDTGTVQASVKFVGLRQVQSAATDDNLPVKEFLSGNTDEGREIFFRADTQQLQLQGDPEMYSNLLAVITEMERGTLTKVFASIDDGPYFQLEGNAIKGISVVKPSIPTPKVKPPVGQLVQLSYRDSSKQRCRLIQTAMVTLPTQMDYTP